MTAHSHVTRPIGSTLLVGDIGGTRTRLMLYDAERQTSFTEAVFPSQEFSSLEQIVGCFMAESNAARPVAAAFGVAGPVHDGVASITNLPWVLDESQLEGHLGIPRVHLANDLVASARGCLDVGPSKLTVLTPAPPARRGANLGVIAAGTGLGEARLVWCGDRYLVLPTEGGHTDYAPRSAIEADLWQFLSARFPEHVSYERVLSGAGLSALTTSSWPVAGASSRRGGQAWAGRPQRASRGSGLAGEDESAEHAVDLFAFIYSAEGRKHRAP